MPDAARTLRPYEGAKTRFRRFDRGRGKSR